jgi:hypothetical protein
MIHIAQTPPVARPHDMQMTSAYPKQAYKFRIGWIVLQFG